MSSSRQGMTVTEIQPVPYGQASFKYLLRRCPDKIELFWCRFIDFKLQSNSTNLLHQNCSNPSDGPLTVGTASLETSPSNGDYGLMASLFYPANAEKNAPSKWLLGPRSFYAVGYGDFAKIPRWFSKSVIATLLNPIRMPALQSAPPISGGKKLPVAIFCHGLAGNQTTYSTFCGSLASRGIVVLSIEHRDGSASVSARNNYAERIGYAGYPEDVDEALKFRQTQLRQRVVEVKTALAVLKILNESPAKLKNLLNSSLPDLTGMLDLDSPIIIGHSFGGATAFDLLQDPSTPFAAGIILDPWMWAMPSFSAVTKPIISVQSGTFHWRENLTQLKEVWDKSNSLLHNKFAVVKDTGHQDVSDLPGIFYWITRWVKKSVDPKRIFASYDILSSGWLKEVLGDSNEILKSISVGTLDGDLVALGDDAFSFLDSVVKK
ncbi:Platelet-activating factor acetylhydrolase [Entophlyctis luteolus]|nr:Platelet-activating factor acetylhydrolase [Entophlyctis luteolus]